MTKLELLTKSVEDRRPISFQYNKPDKSEGVRIGNVHAIFIFTSINGEISTKLDIVQTDGVSDSADKVDFPCWRKFNIDFLSNVKLLESSDKFEIEKGYNPESYDNPIAKI